MDSFQKCNLKYHFFTALGTVIKCPNNTGSAWEMIQLKKLYFLQSIYFQCTQNWCCLKMLLWRHLKGLQCCNIAILQMFQIFLWNKQINMTYWMRNQFCKGVCQVCSWLCKTWETLVNAVWNVAAWKCH